MKIRCRAQLYGKDKLWHLTAAQEETADHMALKLSACLMFSAEDAIPEPSPRHPALQGQDYQPDVMALDAGGYVRLWVECGQVSLRKMEKISRRFQEARIVIVKKSIRDGKQFRERLREETKQAVRTEIWAFEEGHFAHWKNYLAEDTHIIGEAKEKFINVVVNGHPFVADLHEIP